MEVYHSSNDMTSFISDVMLNFNSDFYYKNDSYMTACYLEGQVLE